MRYVDDIFGSQARETIKSLKPGELLLLENTRFYSEESIARTPAEHAKSHMVRKLAPLFDLFVNDAFSVSHRSHCSVVGFTEVLSSVAGILMDKEITALDKGLTGNEHPTIFALGGTKADDSIKVMQHILKSGVADKVLLSGVVATVFMMAYMMIAGTVTILVHPLFYFLPVSAYLWTKKHLGDLAALVALPFFWVAYEYSHTLSEWSFPWLTLGSTQTYDLARIQFIDVTGVLGLSLWILILNCLAFALYSVVASRGTRRNRGAASRWRDCHAVHASVAARHTPEPRAGI